MSVPFHCKFYCFYNVNEIVIAFRNLNFEPLSLSRIVFTSPSITPPNFNETRRISENIVFIRQIRKRIICLEIDQSQFVLRVRSNSSGGLKVVVFIFVELSETTI